MSEYFFNKLDKAKKVSRTEWLNEAYVALKRIKDEEDYLFFKMNNGVSEELDYYKKNCEELDEIIEVLDKEYAVCAYHEILRCIIETEQEISEGLSLEHLLIREKKDGDEILMFYAFPEGTLELVKDKKNILVEKDKKRNEGMYA